MTHTNSTFYLKYKKVKLILGDKYLIDGVPYYFVKSTQKGYNFKSISDRKHNNPNIYVLKKHLYPVKDRYGIIKPSIFYVPNVINITKFNINPISMENDKEYKEITIIAPEGYVIDDKNSTKNVVKFKKIEQEKPLPRQFSELDLIEGYYVNNTSNVVSFRSDSVNEFSRNVFPTREHAEASLAISQLLQLRDIYNDGWMPDSMSSRIYHISVIQSDIVRGTTDNYNKLLSFKTQEIRDIFYDVFLDLIKIAKPFL